MGLFDRIRDAIETNNLVANANRKVDEQFNSPHTVHDNQEGTSAGDFKNWEEARKEADTLNDAAGSRRYVPRQK